MKKLNWDRLKDDYNLKNVDFYHLFLDINLTQASFNSSHIPSDAQLIMDLKDMLDYFLKMIFKHGQEKLKP